MKDLRFDNANSRCVPHAAPDPALLRQLHRLAVERRPEACLGCGYEHGCSLHGCAAICRALYALEGGLKMAEYIDKAELIKRLDECVDKARRDKDILIDNILWMTATVTEAMKMSVIDRMDVVEMQWVAVTDRLPEEGEVLVTNGFTIAVAPASSVQRKGTCISHWMPLPKLPGEGDAHA